MNEFQVEKQDIERLRLDKEEIEKRRKEGIYKIKYIL